MKFPRQRSQRTQQHTVLRFECDNLLKRADGFAHAPLMPNARNVRNGVAELSRYGRWWGGSGRRVSFQSFWRFLLNSMVYLSIESRGGGSMMDRITNIVLRISLLLASVGSLLSLTKMTIEHFVPISYYWWGSVAFFGATIALAAAIRVRDDRFATSLDPKPGDAKP